jgi:UDP-2,3-diacylglucosamine hydrolase
MNKIAIIAGSGSLPLLIGQNLINKNYNIFYLCIKGFVNIEDYKDYNYTEISITSFSNILDQLKIKKINNIIMAGKIIRPSLSDIKFDLSTLSLIKEYLLESKGDDKLLTIISNFFLKKGYPLFNWVSECPELFSSEDLLTFIKPSKQALLNKAKGLKLFEIIGKADIGQSIVVQNQLVIGIEAIEGTDNLIKRCFKYKKKGDLGIVIKLSKYKQNLYLDIPVIGLETLKNIKKYNYEGIFIEKNKCILLNKEEIIEYCNSNNLFISTIYKNES